MVAVNAELVPIYEFRNPGDTKIILISRTVGTLFPDRGDTELA
jgi:hypothetical protein